MTTNWLSNEEQALWRAFIAASSGLSTSLDASLKKSDEMNLDDYEVLVILSESDGNRLRMSNLSDQLLHSRSRLTQRIDRLEKRGFIVREKCKDDARGTWAVLTAAGTTALTKAAPSHLEHARSLFFDHIDPASIPAITDSFQRVAQQFRE